MTVKIIDLSYIINKSYKDVQYGEKIRSGFMHSYANMTSTNSEIFHVLKMFLFSVITDIYFCYKADLQNVHNIFTVTVSVETNY